MRIRHRLNVRNAVLGSLIAAAVLSLPVRAEDHTQWIGMSAEDAQRLGIEYRRASDLSDQQGRAVLAEVTLAPQQQQHLYSRYDSVIGQWHISGGARVKQGDAVVTLISSALAEQEGSWLQAAHASELADINLRKDESLFREGVIAQQRLQQTQRSAQQARFAEQAQRQALITAGLDAQALKQIKDGTLTPGEQVLTAPHEGVVNVEYLPVGAAIAAQQRVASIVDAQPLWVRASVDADAAAALQIGDRLQLDETQEPLQLMSKNPVVSYSTQRQEILAKFEAEATVKPGQQVTLRLPKREWDIVLPEQAVTHNGDLNIVYVREGDGFAIRAVRLEPFGVAYKVLGGLQADEQVVIRGTAQLKGVTLGLGGGE